jgi:hypothetical protein
MARIALTTDRGANMPSEGETTFVLHGLDTDNKIVRADPFGRKFGTLINGLRAADRYANGKLSFIYMLEGCAKESTSARFTLREKRRSSRSAISSIDTYSEVATSIYNGGQVLGRFPPTLIRHVGNLCAGAERSFHHAEISFANDNAIRIDDFLIRQVLAAQRQFDQASEGVAPQFFNGTSYGSFDGAIEELDARGTILRGKLIPTGGRAEIDCVMNMDRIPDVREKFHQRASVSGVVTIALIHRGLFAWTSLTSNSWTSLPTFQNGAGRLRHPWLTPRMMAGDQLCQMILSAYFGIPVRSMLI